MKTMLSLVGALLLAGCSTLYDKDGNVIVSGRRFGSNLKYRDAKEFYESGALKSHTLEISTEETASTIAKAGTELAGMFVQGAGTVL